MSPSKPFYSPKSKSLHPRLLHEVYQTLFEHFGPQHWWPGESPFEIMVGAILTQNTAWTNVEKAIMNLKRERVLTPKALFNLTPSRLARLIRPAGYFNIKARRIRNFTAFYLCHFGGKIEKMRILRTAKLRQMLLDVNGIGRETADSILLYAALKPIFVIDAYTRRIFARHRIAWRSCGRLRRHSPASLHEQDYESWRALFETSLPRNLELFNDFHAQIVALGKNYCRPKNPVCKGCPLQKYL